MPQYFDCLNCGLSSLMAESPPKCPRCSTGTGVIRTTDSDPLEPTQPFKPVSTETTAKP